MLHMPDVHADAFHTQVWLSYASFEAAPLPDEEGEEESVRPEEEIEEEVSFVCVFCLRTKRRGQKKRGGKRGLASLCVCLFVPYVTHLIATLTLQEKLQALAERTHKLFCSIKRNQHTHTTSHHSQEKPQARAERARDVYSRAFKSFREDQPDAKEEAQMVLDSWKEFEEGLDWRCVLLECFSLLSG